MKNALLTLCFLLFFSITLVHAQEDNIAGNVYTAHIYTEIVEPVSVIEYQMLNFGKFTTAVGGGIIQINPSSERTSVGNIQLMGNDESAGKFVVYGIPGRIIFIVLPQESTRIYKDGSYVMEVKDYTSDLPLSGKEIDESTGKIEVSIGASLQVGSPMQNPTGIYTGTYQIAFTYN
jgi:hypothetical protein